MPRPKPPPVEHTAGAGVPPVVWLLVMAILLLALLAGCDKPRKAALPQEGETPVAVAPPPSLPPSIVPQPVPPPLTAPAPVPSSPPPLAVVLKADGRPKPTPSVSRFSRKYDVAIERAARRWLPTVPWRLWKAQLYQESRLDPLARSPVGAEGIAQFMPYTWAEISKQMGLGAIPATSASHAIDAGAFYMANLRAAWKAPRPEEDRHNLAMAAYNAGMGNLLRSQKACGDPPGYEPIMECLHLVTGRHAAETRGYAPSIRKWHKLMEIEP